MINKNFSYALIFAFLALAGCSSTKNGGLDVSAGEHNEGALETYNRAMFSFNNKVDKFVIRPVAKGYKAVTPELMRRGVSNFFSNIDEPVSAVNHILQGELSASGYDMGRFVINTTLGVVGLFDVASKWGMDARKTGFDETLATWCVSDGPFIILPIMGPSTPRATAGFLVDGYTSPMFWIANESGDNDAWAYYYGAASLKYLNLMAENLTFLESLEEGSVDYYEAMKSAYMQNRGKIKRCGADIEESSPDYDFDMDDMDD